MHASLAMVLLSVGTFGAEAANEIPQVQPPASGVATCGAKDAQTIPVRSGAGFVVLLKVHSEDDHGKNTHLCETHYSLQITRPDGSSPGPFTFGVSDDAWERPLRFRIEGFSGDDAFIYVSEGLHPPYLQVLEYDMNHGRQIQNIFVDRHFTQTLSPECAATLHVVGIRPDGLMVLASDAKGGCSRVQHWELNPNKTRGGRLVYEFPRYLRPTTEITKLEAGSPQQP